MMDGSLLGASAADAVSVQNMVPHAQVHLHPFEAFRQSKWTTEDPPAEPQLLKAALHQINHQGLQFV